MGANLLILASTVLLPPSQHDTTTNTEQPANGIAFERLSDLLQYNRVQGLSFGLGYRARLPGTRTTGPYATARYGLSDERVTGRLTMVHESRRGRFALSGYYDVADVDPVSPGPTLGNSANGLFAGHDNADYLLARGGSANFQILVGAGVELLVRLVAPRCG
jgi:hypothetical protein